MNAYGYFEELTGESPTEKLPITPSDALRQWLNNLNTDAIKENDGCTTTAFNHDVSVFKFTGLGKQTTLYLYTKSPQQKIYRRSLPTLQARGNMDDLKAGLERFLSKMEAKQEKQNARKLAKKNARQNFVNPYKVGNFLYSSWGYEQTNREFYQIIEVRSTALLIREVSQNRTRDSHDSGTCSPVRDSFIKPAQWVTIQISESYHHIPSPIHGNLYAYEGKPVYFSDGY